jgi:hypothetical protein
MSPGGKGGRWVGLTTLPPSCADSGSLSILEHNGPVQDCTGIASSTTFSSYSTSPLTSLIFIEDVFNPSRLVFQINDFQQEAFLTKVLCPFHVSPIAPLSFYYIKYANRNEELTKYVAIGLIPPTFKLFISEHTCLSPLLVNVHFSNEWTTCHNHANTSICFVSLTSTNQSLSAFLI